MVNNKFIFILSFMKGVHFFQPSTIAQTFCKLGMKTVCLQNFLQKGNNLNKKMDPTITGIKLYNTVTCKERNVFLGATNT